MIDHKQHASDKSGMLPGTMIYIGEKAPAPTHIHVHIYSNQNYQRQDNLNLRLIKQALDNDQHVWIDVAGLADVNLISQLCTELKIHPLLAEDILNTHQRPKLEVFEQYIFLVFKLIDHPSDSFTYSNEQFSLLAKKNLLLTFRESEQFDLSPLYHRLSAELSMIRQHGSDYLTYLIIDSIVDHYFNFVEASSQVLFQMEEALIYGHVNLKLEEIYIIKRHSLILRKTIAPLSSMIKTLLVDPCHLVNESYRLYYRDLHDHILRLLDSITMNHDMTSSMLEIYLSTVNNKMSQTMKVLTQFASIFIPLTFISSIYGMNFKYMPELNYRLGYPITLAFMASVAIGMLAYFKRKKIF